MERFFKTRAQQALEWWYETQKEWWLQLYRNALIHSGGRGSSGLQESYLFLHWARTQDVVFEGDFEIIYKHLVSDSTCTTAFSHIIEDSRRLATRLRSVSFSHVRRKGNKVADKLAKLAKFLYEPQIWLEDIHSDVTNFVILDRSFLPS